eukprot:TRINITY_DN3009_c0_g1_i1.p1 TRINITY_DN3009_c0_g1~~TRINITY_DN3009_c0_g1_i1.p1  ORF type:complete len:338 (+),score=46.33 TRINITY_DN3009_c0_g1_i1:87-1100(+)
MMNPVLMSMLAVFVIWIFIAAGAAAVFKKDIPLRPLTFAYGLASGVMLAAVFFSLLQPSLEAANELGSFPLLPVGIGFLLGCLFVHMIERALPGDDGIWCRCLRRNLPKKPNRAAEIRKSVMVRPEDIPTSESDYRLMDNESLSSSSLGEGLLKEDGTSSQKLASSLPGGLSKRSLLLLIAVFSENLPEGVAIGVAFGAVKQELTGSNNALKQALILTLGMCISSLPEALAIALPLRIDMTPLKSWILATLSGVSTLCGAILGAVAVSFVQSLLPYALAFAAGAMIYVVVREMLPEAMSLSSVNVATLGFMIGFMLLMSLDVLFSSAPQCLTETTST